MKLFSLLALVACLALVGCEKKPDAGAGSGTSGGAAASTNAPATK